MDSDSVIGSPLRSRKEMANKLCPFKLASGTGFTACETLQCAAWQTVVSELEVKAEDLPLYQDSAAQVKPLSGGMFHVTLKRNECLGVCHMLHGVKV
jgi:hypothetical protein